MIEIRQLSIEDYDEMLNLWLASGLTSLKPKGRDSREEIEKQMKMFPGGFIGAFADGKLVGIVVATHDGRKGWINRLAVHPNYRRKGIAKKLIEEAEEYLKKEGMRIICALIEDWNTASINLFQKCGYKMHRDIIYFSKRESEEV